LHYQLFHVTSDEDLNLIFALSFTVQKWGNFGLKYVPLHLYYHQFIVLLTNMELDHFTLEFPTTHVSTPVS